MTYEAFEESTESGQPVEFYDFGLGDESFNYTSAAEVIVIGAITYTPVSISRSNVLLGTDQRKDNVTVNMPSGVAPADRYIEIVPGQTLTLTIRRYHANDGVTPQLVVVFKGIVKSLVYTDNGYKANLSVSPLTSGMANEVPRVTYQGLCNNFLYDAQCQVVEASFKITGQVTLVDGNDITVTGANGQPDGFYTSGIVQLGTSDFRLILKHTGNVLTLLLPFASNVLSGDVDVLAGCDHTIAICKSKFNNVINYNGSAFVPLRNIFQTGID